MGRYARRLIKEAKDSPRILVNERRFWKQDVFNELLIEVTQLLHTDPPLALNLARQGPVLASKISRSAAELEDTQARALGRLGSALRANTRYAEAQVAYEEALSKASSPRTQADIYRRLSHLKTFQGQPTEALATATKAIDILKGLDECIADRHPIGMALTARARAHRALGDTGSAIIDLSTALVVLNYKKQPHLLFFTLHNLALYLFEHKGSSSQDLGQALNHLITARRGIRNYSRPHIAKYKLKWLQALIQVRFGATRQAENFLRTAREGFIKMKAIDDVAHISLDLAELLLREGQPQEARRLTLEALKLGQAHGLHPAAVAALDLWRKANDAESRHLSRQQFIQHLQPYGLKRMDA